ncbi:MAG: tetratricopeptide repeat protein, partial [Polyangiaceae bacterium]|nr:tetratricopeptide repeat protein [Polyangiaceae bacterium]
MAIVRDAILRSIDRLVERKRYKQAILRYEDLLRQTPDDARLLLRVGDLHARTGSYALAVEMYARAGRCYASDGFAAKAVAVYKQVQQLIESRAPHLAEYYLGVYPTLAQLYEELQLPSEAAAMYATYAGVLARAGRMREAAIVLRVVVQIVPDNPVTWLRLGEALMEEGDADEALAQFEQAAQLLASRNLLDEAIKVLEHALKQGASASLARRAADLYLRRGRGKDGMLALLRLQVAFQAEPENLETLDMLARAFEAIGQKPRAFEVRKETVQIARKQQAFGVARQIVQRLLDEAPDDCAVQALLRTLPSEAAAPKVGPDIGDVEPESLTAAQTAEAAPERHVVTSTVIAAEDLSPEAGVDPAAQLERLRAQAVAFVDRGETAKAIHALRVGLKLDPSSVQLRRLLVDVLARDSCEDEATQQFIRVAGEPAWRVRTEQASCEAHRTPAPLQPEPQSLADLGTPASSRAAGTDAHAHAVVPSDLLVQTTEQPAPATADGASPASSEGVRSNVLIAGAGPIAERAWVLRRGFRGEQGVDAALEEAEFFMTRGLFEDAIGILEESKRRNPNDPRIGTRLAELRAAQSREADLARPSVLGLIVPTQQAAQFSASIDSIATTLTVLGGSAVPDETAAARSVDDVDVDSLFDGVRQGIAAHSADARGASQYDLGVAYLEMGKLEDALSSFQLTAADPARACVSWSMIATVYERRGEQG